MKGSDSVLDIVHVVLCYALQMSKLADHIDRSEVGDQELVQKLIR